jgi:hypothetical protein
LLQLSGFAYPVAAITTSSPFAVELVYLFTAIVIIDGTFQKISEKNITSPGIIRSDLAFIFSVAFFGFIGGWGWTEPLGSWLGVSCISAIVLMAVLGSLYDCSVGVYYNFLLLLRLVLYLPLVFSDLLPSLLFEQAFKFSGWVVLGGCALLSVTLISTSRTMLLWCMTAAVPVVTRRIDLLVLGAIGAQDVLLNSRLTYSLAAIPLTVIGNIRLLLGVRATLNIMFATFMLSSLACFMLGLDLDSFFSFVFLLLCLANVVYLFFVEGFQFGCIVANNPGMLIKNNLLYFLLVFLVNFFCMKAGGAVGGVGELLAIAFLAILVRFYYAKQ